MLFRIIIKVADVVKKYTAVSRIFDLCLLMEVDIML